MRLIPMTPTQEYALIVVTKPDIDDSEDLRTRCWHDVCRMAGIRTRTTQHDTPPDSPRAPVIPFPGPRRRLQFDCITGGRA
jgi:hypothetical protein